MKRILIATIAITCLCGSAALAQISGSKHDLSTSGGITDKSTTENQTCIFCHTPHQGTMTEKPLWNHTLSTATYTVYSNSTIQATITAPGPGTAGSNLCLSCHDGTVAVNSLGNGGTPTMGSGNELDATAKIVSTRPSHLGTDLGNDHPVNFTYDAALATADGELQTPNSSNFVDAAQQVPLFSAKVQCASCHQPHKNTHGNFLRISNSSSTLCLKCHIK